MANRCKVELSAAVARSPGGDVDLSGKLVAIRRLRYGHHGDFYCRTHDGDIFPSAEVPDGDTSKLLWEIFTVDSAKSSPVSSNKSITFPRVFRIRIGSHDSSIIIFTLLH